MLTNQPQFGVFHSTFLVYRYIEVYDKMCKWWETTLRIQTTNKENKMKSYSQILVEQQREAQEEHNKYPDDCDPPEDNAYTDALTVLHLMPNNLEVPDIMWLPNGGCGMEWRPPNGIATLGCYGNEIAVYGMTHGDKNDMSGHANINKPLYIRAFFESIKLAYNYPDMIE